MDWTLLRNSGCVVQEDAALRDFTTFRIGGPCPCVVTCADEKQLVAAVQHFAASKMPFVLIGGGSNLLVSDAGIESAVIRYVTDRPDIVQDGGTLDVSGAVLLDDLARYTVARGLEGLEYASGIPGTVGGAVAGNAGAFGRQIGDEVESVLLMDRAGKLSRRSAREMGFAYRSSVLHDDGGIVVSVRLRVRPGDPAALASRRAEIMELRKSKHPDWHTTQTAGSFFRNIEPTSAAERRQAAGWFLEQAGAKGMRVGGARVFEKHANIIVADPGARAADVLELSKRMAAAVEAKFGLRLVPEVRRLGTF